MSLLLFSHVEVAALGVFCIATTSSASLTPGFYRSRPRTNGATQTFRRPSLASNTSFSRESNQPSANDYTPSAGVYVPPHLTSNHPPSPRNGASSETRYSKDQLLELFRSQAKKADNIVDIQKLFVDGWNPGAPNDTSNGSWAKRDDHREVAVGPEICWDHGGSIVPLGLMEMDDQEKEVRD